jgi:hypothetical protein
MDDNHLALMQGLAGGHQLTSAELVARQCNGAGVPRDKLHASTGRPKGARNLHAKHPSAISKAFTKAGLDWKTDFALAIKVNDRERIQLWLKLLPYLITQRNHSTTVRKWRGKASKAAMIALEALEGR